MRVIFLAELHFITLFAALRAAAIKCHLKIALMLLELGADFNAPGSPEDGRTWPTRHVSTSSQRQRPTGRIFNVIKAFEIRSCDGSMF